MAFGKNLGVYEKADMMTVAARKLRKLMHDESISQVEVARRTGLSKTTVVRALEGREGNITMSTLCRILESMGYTAELNFQKISNHNNTSH